MHKRNHHHGDSQADQFPIHPAVSARYSMTEMGYIPYRYYIIYNLSYRQRNEHYIYKHPIADQILPVNHSQPPSPLLFFNRREFYSLVPRLFVISVRAAISGAQPGHFIEFECTFQYVLPHVLNERRTLIKTCTRPIGTCYVMVAILRKVGKSLSIKQFAVGYHCAHSCKLS